MCVCVGVCACHLVPLPLSVQSDDDHGRIHQVTVTVEGEVVVFPGDVQHVPADGWTDECFPHFIVLCSFFKSDFHTFARLSALLRHVKQSL